MKTQKFEYNIEVEKTESGMNITGYNSPYKKMGPESVEDIEVAKEMHVFDIDDLKVGEKKNVKFICKFIKDNNEEIIHKVFTQYGIQA